jgi:hypothetical protein
MTDFFTRCSRKKPFESLIRWMSLCVLVLCGGAAVAQGVVEPGTLRAERADDEIQVSAQVQFDLPAAVEDALLKGIPLIFVMNAEVVRERWYWYDKRITTATRTLRLAYQPLTRHWRLNVSSGEPASASVGLALNQSYDGLGAALTAIKRVSRWKIADAADLDMSQKYKVDFRFRLDLTQLPRPFQISMLGDNDWIIAIAAQIPLLADNPR